MPATSGDMRPAEWPTLSQPWPCRNTWGDTWGGAEDSVAVLDGSDDGPPGAWGVDGADAHGAKAAVHDPATLTVHPAVHPAGPPRLGTPIAEKRECPPLWSERPRVRYVHSAQPHPAGFLLGS